jgi:hypothetical protein
MKKPLKLAFVDFAVNWGLWPDPVKFFVDILSDEYDVEVMWSDFGLYIFTNVGKYGAPAYGQYPDLVIFSHPGEAHKEYRCPKIFFSGEPCDLNFDNYDYAMTYHFSDDPRHYRLPLYALYGDVNRLTAPRVCDPAWAEREFCCVLFGKPYPHEQTPREAFFRELCKYKHVKSAGRHLNNTGFIVTPENKAEYIKNFKFVLSFESCALPGFVTEKIFEPLLMNTVPIYWGDNAISVDFNAAGFIQCNHLSFEEAIQYIKYVDTHDDVYREMILAPRYASPYVDKRNILAFFREVLRDA